MRANYWMHAGRRSFAGAVRYASAMSARHHRRAAAVALWLLAGCAPAPELPVFGTVDRLDLELADGRSIDAGALDGTIHVVDFVFTSCEMACPMMTARMKELQDELAPESDVRLLSISTDPEVDTPAVLRAYAERWGADPDRWWFARAPLEEVVRLSEQEFLLSAQGLPMGHSLKFALVDGQRRIRGYYDSEDAEALLALRRDIDRLAG